MKNRIYMKVTLDKYELPVAVAGSVPELAKILGVKTESIRSSLSIAKTGKFKRCRYVVVEVDE
jgi:hypothetical protein